MLKILKQYPWKNGFSLSEWFFASDWSCIQTQMKTMRLTAFRRSKNDVKWFKSSSHPLLLISQVFSNRRFEIWQWSLCILRETTIDGHLWKKRPNNSTDQGKLKRGFKVPLKKNDTSIVKCASNGFFSLSLFFPLTVFRIIFSFCNWRLVRKATTITATKRAQKKPISGIWSSDMVMQINKRLNMIVSFEKKATKNFKLHFVLYA